MQWTLEDGTVTGLNGHDWHGKLAGGVGGKFTMHDRANNLIEFTYHKEWVVGQIFGFEESHFVGGGSVSAHVSGSFAVGGSESH